MSVSSTEAHGHAAAYWSGQAARYDEWGDLAHGHPRYQQAWTAAVAALAGRPASADPLRVVDVGTGTGELALLLARLGHRVTGYDIAPGMLERARANLAAAGIGSGADNRVVDHPGSQNGNRVELVESPAQELPLADGTVDLVISRMVFWALADPVAALHEWRRVLAPGGRLVVIDALHFQPPRTMPGRIRHHAGHLFWSTLDRVDRLRSPGSTAAVPRRPPSPGATWRSVDEPAGLFEAAGLRSVRVDWLDDVAEAQRRTAPLRWRIAGLLPRFYTLSWDAPA